MSSPLEMSISRLADGLFSKVKKTGAGDRDGEGVHRMLFCPVASRRAHHSRSVRQGQCVHDVDRLADKILLLSSGGSVKDASNTAAAGDMKLPHLVARLADEGHLWSL